MAAGPKINNESNFLSMTFFDLVDILEKKDSTRDCRKFDEDGPEQVAGGSCSGEIT